MSTETRFVVAIVLCVLIYMVFSMGVERPQKPVTQTPPKVTETDRPATTNPTPTVDSGDEDPTPAADAVSFEERTLTLRNSRVSVVTSSVGAALSRVELRDYREGDFQTPLILLGPEKESAGALQIEIDDARYPPLAAVGWEVESSDERKVVFRYPVGDGVIRKTLELGGDDDPYLFWVQIEFASGLPAAARYQILGPRRLRYEKEVMQPNQVVTAFADPQGGFDHAEREAVGLIPHGGKIVDARPQVMWTGLESNYFAFVIRPEDERADLERICLGSMDEKLESLASSYHDRGLQTFPYRVGFDGRFETGRVDRYEVYLGPKDRELLAKYEAHGYTELVYYGDWLGGLVRLFLGLLGFFHSVFGSWGVAIICLTLMVKLALHPINKRNQAMMQRQQKKMQKIQPQMNKIKEKNKNDPVRANREIQELMRQQEVNPLALFGGCLLIFLQLPIWFGLISTFRLALELRHEPFLYITDLTQADQLFPLGFSIPFLGDHFNLLPVLYVILTLINQRLMPKPADPQMQQQQKMMTFMMVAFGFIFYNFSSGLLVYFMTSAALGIVEQKIIRAELKREGLVDAPPQPAT